MEWEKQILVIGLTGAFGSGSTTAARHLRDERGFEMITLSDCIRAEWKKRNSSKSKSSRKMSEKKPAKEPSRFDLQRLGDELRQKNKSGVLIERALETLKEKGVDPKYIVFDGIRNLGEIERLRDIFGYKFSLIAVLSSNDDRWGRIGSAAYLDKGLTLSDFIQDDQRDSNEEVAWGQQVQLCIDRADILVDNSTTVTLPSFKTKVLEFVDLVAGKSIRSARMDEILMNIAFSASHSSKCLKRHVGAVIVDDFGRVVGVGYNENTLGTNPCVEEPQYGNQCYRDIVRNDHFKRLSVRQILCPVCASKLPEITGPPWRCPVCWGNGVKTNLEAFFFPDRAMNWCTAIHAEVWAILAAGDRGRGGILYTTTFPCFQCAEKITQAEIRKIIFTEPYPDPHSQKRLVLAKVELQQFEGVRSSSFERIFSRTKPD
jgi:deoxycytidylate deaminase